MATANSDKVSAQTRNSKHTIREANNIPTGPPPRSPAFQPKYCPQTTIPTPSAQMSNPRSGFFSVGTDWLPCPISKNSPPADLQPRHVPNLDRPIVTCRGKAL